MSLIPIDPYMEMMPSMDLCTAALEDAAQRIGPSFTYDLYVSERLYVFARTLMRQIAADAIGNPFAPYINVHMDPRHSYCQWILVANGKRIGSNPT